MTNDMTKGSPGRTIIFFALPILLGNVFQQLYNIVDSVVVGNFVGPDALAAVGAAFPIVFMLVAIAMGLTMGCSVLISQYFGSGRYSDLRRSLYTCIIFLAALAVVLTFIGIVCSPFLLRLLNTPENIFADSLLYLQIFFGGLFFMFMYNAASALFRSLGDSKTPLYFLIFATILNIVLDLLFVVVFGWGVAGVAYATLIAQALSAVGSVLFIIKKMTIIRFKKEERVFDTKLLATMLRFGIPSTIQQLVVSLGMMCIQGLINSYGSTVVAGFAACSKIDSIALMPMMNISMALSTFVAQNMGAGTIERVKRGYLVTMRMSIIISISISALIYFFGSFLMGLFVDSNSASGVIDFGVTYLRIVSFWYILHAVMLTTNGVLRGSGDMLAFMANTVISLVARVAATYVLARFIGYAAIWWGIPIGWGLGAIFAVIRYFSGKWKTKVAVQNIKCEV